MIDLDPDALHAFGLSASEVTAAVSRQNLTLPAGTIREGATVEDVVRAYEEGGAACISVLTDEPRFDGAATLAIGVLLVAIAVILVVEMKSLLIGEAASPEQQRAVQDAIEDAPGVRSLLHMRTLHLGPDELLVAAKIELAPGLGTAEVAGAINAAEARIRAAVPIARAIYLEPDIRL